MSWRKLIPLLLAAGPGFAADGFMIGAGAEGDSSDGLGISAMGSVGLTADTWLSLGIAKSSVELESSRELESLYGDLELDHYFDPIGIRLGIAYWGDPDVLESTDWRAAGYFRNNKVTLSLDYEYRDFDLTIPPTDFFTGRRIRFAADGIGLTARLKTSDNTSIRLRGIKYDYSLPPFRPVDSDSAARLLSVSRLSLINSLVDHRAGISLSIDQGPKNWTFDVSTWESIFTGSRTKSWTVRFLFPLSNKTDMELGAGYDDSELYGDVTFFSMYLFFYGN